MSDFSSCIKLLDSNYLNNDFCITNIALINFSAGGRVGGGFGLWFEVPSGQTPKLTLKDCLYEGNVAHGNWEHILDGFGGAFGTGLGTMDRMTLIIDNCTFIKNKAQRKGGALSIHSSYPTDILNCTFINNEAEEGGGAIFIMSYGSMSRKELTYTIQECHFESNKDLSGNNNAIFKSNPSSHTADSKLIIKDRNFTNSNSSDTYSNEGYEIPIESGKISIEGTQIEFIGDSSQSSTGLNATDINE